MDRWLDTFGRIPPSIFDDSPYYPHHGTVRVFTGETTIRLHYRHLKKIFPQLPIRNGEIDLYKWSAQFAHRLKPHNIDKYAARKILSEVFKALKDDTGGFDIFPLKVHHLLQGNLTRDWRSMKDLRSVKHPGGFCHSRLRFITLANLARSTNSHILASSLANFFSTHRREIVGNERSKYLAAWGFALMDIRFKISAAEAANCFRALGRRIEDIRRTRHHIHHFDSRWHDLIRFILEAGSMYRDFGYSDDWSRGRRPQGEHFPWAPRARTMPPPLARRPPLMLPPIQDVVPYRFPPPRPIMNSAPYLGDPVEEEIDSLANRQDVLEQRIDNLEGERMMRPY